MDGQEDEQRAEGKEIEEEKRGNERERETVSCVLEWNSMSFLYLHTMHDEQGYIVCIESNQKSLKLPTCFF